MHNIINGYNSRRLKRALKVLACLSLVFTQLFSYPVTVFASVLPYMPAPSKLFFPAEKFTPPVLRGLRFYNNDLLRLDFIIDKGDSAGSLPGLRPAGDQMLKYFMAALTLPSADLWVNLSPYEKMSITTPELGVTELGRDMLGEDYVLKQLASSLTYPESPLGKEFWQKVYQRARTLFGRTDMPINTFNKVWIMPDKIALYEDGDRVFIREATFKVMLDSDYTALKQNLASDSFKINTLSSDKAGQINDVSSKVMREVVIPVITQEVNQGKSFARLRQIYYAVILASWFKAKASGTVLDQAYFNKAKTKGVENSDKSVKEKIYNQYVDAYRKGVYNYTKHVYEGSLKKMQLRRFYSGGCALQEIDDEVKRAPRTPGVDAAAAALGGNAVGMPVELHKAGTAQRPQMPVEALSKKGIFYGNEQQRQAYRSKILKELYDRIRAAHNATFPSEEGHDKEFFSAEDVIKRDKALLAQLQDSAAALERTLQMCQLDPDTLGSFPVPGPDGREVRVSALAAVQYAMEVIRGSVEDVLSNRVGAHDFSHFKPMRKTIQLAITALYYANGVLEKTDFSAWGRMFDWSKDTLPVNARVVFMDITQGNKRNGVYGRKKTDIAFALARKVVLESLAEVLGGDFIEMPSDTQSGDELRFAIRPSIDESGNYDPSADEAKYRKAVAFVNAQLILSFAREYARTKEDIYLDPLFLPAGSIAIKDEADEAAYHGYLDTAEKIQQDAKRRLYNGALTTLATTQYRPRQDGQVHLPANVRVAALNEAKIYGAKVRKAFNGKFSAEENLTPCISSETVNGKWVPSEEFWREFIADIKSRNEGCSWLVRGPPDTYFIVRKNQGSSVVQIIRVSHYYHAVKGLALNSFEDIRKGSGRTPVRRAGEENIYDGFKMPNDAWGHLYGNDLIRLEGAAMVAADALLGEGIVDSSEKLVRTLGQALAGVNKVAMSSQGYEVYMDVTEAMSDQARDGDVMSIIQALSQARSSAMRRASNGDDYSQIMPDVPCERAKVELKRYSDNSEYWEKIAKENSKRQQHEKKRASNDIYFDTRRLQANALLADMIGKSLGYERNYTEYLSPEITLLDNICGNGQQLGIIQQIGAASQDRPGLGNYDTVLTLMQIGILLSNIDRYDDAKRSVEKIIEDRRSFLGFAPDTRPPARQHMNRSCYAAVLLLSDIFHIAQRDGLVAAAEKYRRIRVEQNSLFARIENSLGADIDKIMARFFEAQQSQEVLFAARRKAEGLPRRAVKAIGKTVVPVSLNDRNIGLRYPDGSRREFPLEDVDIDIEACRGVIAGAARSRSDMVNALFTLFNNSRQLNPVAFRQYFGPVGDAAGSANNGVIALHHDFIRDNIAIFHEIVELLIDREDITLNLDGNILSLRSKNGLLDVSLPLDTESLEIARRASAGDPESVSHYNIRALTRFVLGALDAQLEVRIGQFKNSPENLGGIDLDMAKAHISSSGRKVSVNASSVALGDIDGLEAGILRMMPVRDFRDFAG